MVLARYGRVDLLCLDELGYLELDKTGAKLLFQIFTLTEPEFAIRICEAVMDVIEPTPDKKLVLNLPATDFSLPELELRALTPAEVPSSLTAVALRRLLPWMTTPELSTLNTSKSSDSFELPNVNPFSIRPSSEVTAIIGPSGCGKSTALNCIAGLMQLSGGSIWLDDQRIDTLPPEKRGFGMVFQNYALFPHMTVTENIGFPLSVRGVPAADLAQRVERALDMVQLGGFGSRRPAQLSGGQQQRVAGREVVLLRHERRRRRIGLRTEKLPHQLVEAFKATLEETVLADLMQDSPALALSIIREANRHTHGNMTAPAENLEVAINRLGLGRTEELLARLPAGLDASVLWLCKGFQDPTGRCFPQHRCVTYLPSAFTASSVSLTCLFGLRSEYTCTIDPDGAIT